LDPIVVVISSLDLVKPGLGLHDHPTQFDEFIKREKNPYPVAVSGNSCRDCATGV